MKKILLLAAFAATALNASAQQTRKMPKGERQEMRADMTPEQRADMQAKMMQQKLGLTDDQTMRVRDINMKYMPQRDAAEDRKQEMQQMMKQRDAAYGQVLNPDQMALYQKMKGDRKENMKMRRAMREKEMRRNGDDMREMKKEEMKKEMR